MEKGKKELNYQIEFTHSANRAFYDVVEYLYDHYTVDRAEEIANSLYKKAISLQTLFYRGTHEPRLSHRSKGYRYLLFERSKRKFIKIIYYVDQKSEKIYITDFFPTEMDDTKIEARHS